MADPDGGSTPAVGSNPTTTADPPDKAGTAATDDTGVVAPDASEPTAPATRHRRRWSMRAHLVTVVVVAIVLVAATAGQATFHGFRMARQEAGRSARFHAALAARELGDDVPEIQSLLVRSANSIALATGGNLGALPPERCALNFAEYRVFSSGVLHLVFPDGSVLCSSAAPAAQGKPYASTSILGRVLGGETTSFEGPSIDPVSQRWTLLVAAAIPVPGQRQVSGALVLSLGLEELGPALARRFGGPQRAEYLVTDPSGARVATRSIDSRRWTGSAIAPSRFAAADGGRTAVRRDLSGDRRVYAGARVARLDWRVYAGIDTKRAETQARGALEDRVEGGLLVLIVLSLLTLSGIVVVKRR